MSEYLSFDPKDAIAAGGFLTGKTLTIGGFKLYTTDFNGKAKTEATVVEGFLVFTDDAGKRQIQSQRWIAGYVDNVVPSKDGLGLEAPKGAMRPGIREGSEFHAFCVSLVSAGYEGKLGGPLTNLVGLEFVAGSQVIKRARKASEVDPDAPPKKEYPFVIVASIETLPKDNKKFKALTSEQMDAVEEERNKRIAARRTATAPDSDSGDDDEPEVKPAKKKTPAPVEDDDDDDNDATSDDDDDAEDSDDEDADKGSAAAKAAVLAALEKGAKMKMLPFTKATFAAMVEAEVPKTVRNKAVELVQDEDFLTGIKGITVKNRVVSRA